MRIVCSKLREEIAQKMKIFLMDSVLSHIPSKLNSTRWCQGSKNSPCVAQTKHTTIVSHSEPITLQNHGQQ